MVDYAQLADKAKVIQDAEKLSAVWHKEQKADPCAFLEKVKAHIAVEINKANVELRKRGADIFERIHLPSFDEEIFLTYGTDLLCRVGLGVQTGGCRVMAVISGPPNGYEHSRKEYICNQVATCVEVLHAAGAELPATGYCPDEIAVDIISGLLVGKFH